MLALTNNPNYYIMLTKINKQGDVYDFKIFGRISKDDVCLKKAKWTSAHDRRC